MIETSFNRALTRLANERARIGNANSSVRLVEERVIKEKFQKLELTRLTPE